jgi:hypothetical protein
MTDDRNCLLCADGGACVSIVARGGAEFFSATRPCLTSTTSASFHRRELAGRRVWRTESFLVAV